MRIHILKKINSEHNNDRTKKPNYETCSFPQESEMDIQSSAATQTTAGQAHRPGGADRNRPRAVPSQSGTSPSQSAPQTGQPHWMMTYFLRAGGSGGLVIKGWDAKGYVSARLRVKLCSNSFIFLNWLHRQEKKKIRNYSLLKFIPSERGVQKQTF